MDAYTAHIYICMVITALQSCSERKGVALVEVGSNNAASNNRLQNNTQSMRVRIVQSTRPRAELCASQGSGVQHCLEQWLQLSTIIDVCIGLLSRPHDNTMG